MKRHAKAVIIQRITDERMLTSITWISLPNLPQRPSPDTGAPTTARRRAALLGRDDCLSQSLSHGACEPLWGVRAESPTSCATAPIRFPQCLTLTSSPVVLWPKTEGIVARSQQATLWFLKRPHQGYHIDYCFVPTTWVSRSLSVRVGHHKEWLKHSDRAPLLVSVPDDE